MNVMKYLQIYDHRFFKIFFLLFLQFIFLFNIVPLRAETGKTVRIHYYIGENDGNKSILLNAYSIQNAKVIYSLLSPFDRGKIDIKKMRLFFNQIGLNTPELSAAFQAELYKKEAIETLNLVKILNKTDPLKNLNPEDIKKFNAMAGKADGDIGPATWSQLLKELDGLNNFFIAFHSKSNSLFEFHFSRVDQETVALYADSINGILSGQSGQMIMPWLNVDLQVNLDRVKNEAPIDIESLTRVISYKNDSNNFHQLLAYLPKLVSEVTTLQSNLVQKIPTIRETSPENTEENKSGQIKFLFYLLFFMIALLVILMVLQILLLVKLDTKQTKRKNDENASTTKSLDPVDSSTVKTSGIVRSQCDSDQVIQPDKSSEKNIAKASSIDLADDRDSLVQKEDLATKVDQALTKNESSGTSGTAAKGSDDKVSPADLIDSKPTKKIDVKSLDSPEEDRKTPVNLYSEAQIDLFRSFLSLFKKHQTKVKRYSDFGVEKENVKYINVLLRLSDSKSEKDYKKPNIDLKQGMKILSDENQFQSFIQELELLYNQQIIPDQSTIQEFREFYNKIK